MGTNILPAAFVLPEHDSVLLGPARIYPDTGLKPYQLSNAIPKSEADLNVNKGDLEPTKGYFAAQFTDTYLAEGRQADVYWSQVGDLVSMWIPSFSGVVTATEGFIESESIVATFPIPESIRRLCYCIINNEAAQVTVSINGSVIRFDGPFEVDDSIALGGVFTYYALDHYSTDPLGDR